VCGLFGALWIVLWLVAMRAHSNHASDSGGRDTSSGNRDLLGILFSGRFWAVALLVVGAQIVWHVFRVWLMKFLQTGRGLEEAAALNFSSLYYVATDVGCLVAGAASLQLVRRFGCSPHAARRRVYAAACVCTSTSVFLPWLTGGFWLKAALLIVGAGALALFPCYYGFLQELSSKHVGRMTGILSLWVWSVTSPMHSAFGKLADQTQSYDAGLVIAGLAPWIGVLAMKLLWREALPEASPVHPPHPLSDAS
jgi:ACS family hexuronate transporter-like MFS transporter